MKKILLRGYPCVVVSEGVKIDAFPFIGFCMAKKVRLIGISDKTGQIIVKSEMDISVGKFLGGALELMLRGAVDKNEVIKIFRTAPSVMRESYDDIGAVVQALMSKGVPVLN